LDVTPVGGGAFEGRSPQARSRPVFGGQFLAQALVAAGRTVEAGRVPHSLHAYFLRSGPPYVPICYEVEAVRDGRGFSHREVVARQESKEVFRLACSFQVPAPGLDHDGPAPGVDVGVLGGAGGAGTVDPASFPGYVDWARASTDNQDHEWFTEEPPLDIRFEGAPPPADRTPMVGPWRLWMRMRERVPSDDPVLHAALLAWMSDKTVSDVTLFPHGRRWTDAGSDVLSLDHAMWFLRPSRADEWALFLHEAPFTGGGRGLARGDLFSLGGGRVASVVQEALVIDEGPAGRPAAGAGGLAPPAAPPA
jgi:acyl-CoA thioesterase II